MSKQLPTDDAEFEALMERVDTRLASEEVLISRRPLHALGIISEEFNAEIPMGKPFANAPEALVKNWPFAERVHSWYQERYEERLLHDFRPGRVAFILRHDPWVLQIPRVFGQVQMVVSLTQKSEKMCTNGVTPIYNVLDSVQGLTKTLKRSLGNNELKEIFDVFQLGYKALTTLEYLCPNSLVEAAMADIDTAVDQVMARNPSSGQSRWASLQAAEKILKACIELKGGRYSHTHDLQRIAEEAVAVGLPNPKQEDIAVVQCSASVRYGTESTRLDEAIIAHHASLRICFVVAKAVNQHRITNQSSGPR